MTQTSQSKGYRYILLTMKAISGRGERQGGKGRGGKSQK